jgi:hypothetical protein
MSTSWQTTPISRALDKVLSSLEPGARILVIPYDANAEPLWATLEASALQETFDGCTVFVVWTGESRSRLSIGAVNLETHLNPLTWAACALRRLSGLKVAIVDYRGESHSGWSLARAVRAVRPERLPLRLIDGPANSVPECLTFLKEKPSREGLELILHDLRVRLTERRPDGDRHALANIVGPRILLGDAGMAQATGPERALIALFREAGLIVDVAGGATRPPPVSPPGKEPGHPVRVLLVDDQWSVGWDRWVEKMFSGRQQYRLERMDAPVLLVATLEKAASEDRLGKETRFSLSLPVGQKNTENRLPSPETPLPDLGEETIVLLDLRLFSIRSAIEEAAFVRNRLLPLCRHLQMDGGGKRTPLPWPGFAADELTAAESWCANPIRETDEHLLVLSLLPRLLALADFSLPIVLFSSTGQRHIMDLLKPYGNIITDFDKPRFTGLETADLVTRAEDGFANAMAKAGRLLAARRHCRSILEAPAMLSRVASLPEWRKTRYVELFLDEGDWTHSGATHFSVGGCFAVFDAPSLRDARAKADCFDDALVRRGIRYFESRGIGVEPPDGKLLRKGENIASRLDTWRTEEAAPACLGALRMRIAKGMPGTRKGSLANPESADNRYFLSLKSLLELFFCETVPALAGEGDPSEVVVSVFPATRAVYVAINQQNTAMTNYGLKPTGRRGLFFSLDRSFVYPLVDDILDSHGLKRRTARLLAPQLPYVGEYIDLPQFFVCSRCNKTVEAKGNVATEDLHRDLRCDCAEFAFRPDYRALHYLADELLSQFPDGEKPRPYDALFHDVFPGEFDELWNSELAAILMASRSLDAGDLVGGLASFAPLQPIGKKPRASTWLQRRLLARVPSMTGEEFLRLANRLVAVLPRQKGT